MTTGQLAKATGLSWRVIHDIRKCRPLEAPQPLNPTGQRFRWDESAVEKFKELAAKRRPWRDLRPENRSQTPSAIYQRAMKDKAKAVQP